MKDYTKILAEEQIAAVCTLISTQVFRKLFQKNPRLFGKIKPGFRAEKLSDEETAALALDNYKKPFIAKKINCWIEENLKKVAACCDQYAADGMRADEGLMEALSQSVFHAHVTLYTALSGCSVEHISNIEERVAAMWKAKYAERSMREEARSEKANRGDQQNRIATLEQRLAEAEDERRAVVEEKEQRLSDLSAHHDELQRRFDELQKEYDERAKNIEALQEQLNKYQECETYTDCPSPMAAKRRYDHRSLCEVSWHADTGKIRLNRLADLSSDGSLVAFHHDPSLPPMFDNRRWIYHNDGPEQEGGVALWDWSAEENKNNREVDYIHSSWFSDTSPVEIIILPDCDSMDELITRLTHGIRCNLTSGRTLFAAAKRNEEYFGVLCQREQLVITPEIVRPSDTVYNLPQYRFGAYEILHLSNHRCYFRRLYMGRPSDIVSVKSAIEVVQTIILQAISWPSMKERGVTRADWQRCKEFLGHLKGFSLTEEIAKACHVSRDEAENLQKAFIAHAEGYLSGQSIEDEILASLLSANEMLRTRWMDIAGAAWKEENAQTVCMMDAEIHARQAEQEELRSAYAQLCEEKDALQTEIVQKKQLAEKVENDVAKRIQHAQNDMAAFIAELSVVSGAVQHQMPSTECRSPIFSHGISPAEVPQENHTWREVYDTLALELEEVGTAPNRSAVLAAYLYAAYLAHVPILLTGPNANDIADVVSLSLFGRTCGRLVCAGAFDIEAVHSCWQGGDRVVEIVNPFSHEWLVRLPELLASKETYYIAVHPFPEELPFEPQGLFRYMIPLFTEYFVEGEPNGHVVGGTMADDFAALCVQGRKKIHTASFAQLRTSRFLTNKYQTLFSYMEELLENIHDDVVVLTALLPYALSTGQNDVLRDILSDGERLQLSKSLKEELDDVLGGLM